MMLTLFYVQTAAQNRKDYAELVSNLRRMVDEFKEHPGEHTSSNMSEALIAMAKYVVAQREINC